MIYAMSGADDICDVRGQMIYVMSGAGGGDEIYVMSGADDICDVRGG